MLEDFNISSLEEIKKFLPEYDKQEFALIDIEILPYQFLNWKKADLLLKNIDEESGRKWVKLTYTEAAWMKLVQKMRLYEIPVEAIKSIRDTVKNDVFKALNEYLKKLLTENSKNENQDQIFKSQIKEALDFLSRNDLPRVSPFNTFFNYLLVDQIVRDNNTCIRLFRTENEWVSFITSDDILKSPSGIEIKKHIGQTHFCIAINECIDDLTFSFLRLDDKKLESHGILNDKERELIRLIRTKKFKEIKVKLDKTKEDIIIQFSVDGIMKIGDYKHLASIIGNKKYKNIIITPRNNKEAYYEIIR